jgi:D-alanine-D-alanine ligase
MAKLIFGKIGVLMGGFSTERSISLKSGKAVFESLKRQGLDVVALDIKTSTPSYNVRLIRDSGIDVAFIALHGRFGEDGQVQMILENLGVPYTGSGVMASRLTLDKIASRRIFQVYGLAVPRYKVLYRLGYHKDSLLDKDFPFPIVVKPVSHGSSIGLSIIDTRKALNRAIDLAFSLDESIIIEEYIKGREVTVGILDDMSLPVIEIISDNRFFDYQAKYTPGNTRYIVPANINDAVSRKARHDALLAHRLLGCEDFSRVDMILQGRLPYILEVNTIPGLTQTSLLPKAAKTAGLSFDQLCLRLLELAYEKKKD